MESKKVGKVGAQVVGKVEQSAVASRPGLVARAEANTGAPALRAGS
jgi:hypothetical protein